MNTHDTQYIINVTYDVDLQSFIAYFEGGDPAQYGEGETRYEAMDNLLSNMSDEELEENF